VAALVGALAAPAPTQAAPLAPLSAPRDLKVISYYPSDAGWTQMWDSWRPERLQADFARIAGLHANTVRLIVQAGTFGYPLPSSAYQERLALAVELAARAGLHVQLTLFDWLGQHGLAGSYADLAGSETWASAMLAPYAGDPRIACVELQNELDPRDPAAVAWARTLVPYIQGVLGPGTPVTLSAHGDNPVTALALLQGAFSAGAPDFWTLHLYSGGGERAYWQLRQAQADGSRRPLWLGETGYPTLETLSGYGDLPQTLDAQEAAQAHYLKTVAEAAWRLKLPSIGVWALDDFTADAIPVEPAQRIPAEYHFGLFRLDGTEKPAAAVVRRMFAAGRPSLDFDNGFEHGVSNGFGGLVPAEWSLHGDTNMEVVQDTGVAHTGVASARLRSEDGVPGHAYLYVAPIDAAALAGATASASVWARVASPGADVRLEVDWLDGASRYLSRATSLPARSGGGWRRLVLRTRRPARARSVRIYLVGARLTGSVWFDDATFAWR
jgi:hypothetical protein